MAAAGERPFAYPKPPNGRPPIVRGLLRFDLALARRPALDAGAASTGLAMPSSGRRRRVSSDANAQFRHRHGNSITRKLRWKFDQYKRSEMPDGLRLPRTPRHVRLESKIGDLHPPTAKNAAVAGLRSSPVGEPDEGRPPLPHLENSSSRLSNLALHSLCDPPGCYRYCRAGRSLEDMPRNSSKSYEWTLSGDFPLAEATSRSVPIAEGPRDLSSFPSRRVVASYACLSSSCWD